MPGFVKCPCGKILVEDDAAECWLCHADLRGPQEGGAARAAKEAPGTFPAAPGVPPPPQMYQQPRRRRTALFLLWVSIPVALVVAPVVAGVLYLRNTSSPRLDHRADARLSAITLSTDPPAEAEPLSPDPLSGAEPVVAESTECGFRATFPTAPVPTEETMELAGQSVTISSLVDEESDGRLAVAACTQLPDALALDASELSLYAYDFAVRLSGSVTAVESSEPVDFQGLRGVEFRLHIEDECLRMILAIRGNSVLEFVSATPYEPFCDSAWASFRDSIELFDPPA